MLKKWYISKSANSVACWMASPCQCWIGVLKAPNFVRSNMLLPLSTYVRIFEDSAPVTLLLCTYIERLPVLARFVTLSDTWNEADASIDVWRGCAQWHLSSCWNLGPYACRKTQGNSKTCKGFREHDFSTPPLVKLSA